MSTTPELEQGVSALKLKRSLMSWGVGPKGFVQGSWSYQGSGFRAGAAQWRAHPRHWQVTAGKDILINCTFLSCLNGRHPIFLTHVYLLSHIVNQGATNSVFKYFLPATNAIIANKSMAKNRYYHVISVGLKHVVCCCPLKQCWLAFSRQILEKNMVFFAFPSFIRFSIIMAFRVYFFFACDGSFLKKFDSRQFSFSYFSIWLHFAVLIDGVNLWKNFQGVLKVCFFIYACFSPVD